MKNFGITFLLIFVIMSTGLAQSYIAFHEDFEPPLQSDSLFSTQVASPGINDWVTNDRLQVTGTWSDTCQVKDQATVFLTSIPFNTQGYTFIELHFDHICKVNFYDTATIEVSNDGGLSWITLSGNEYSGTGSYASNFNRFNAASYGALWKPTQATAVPDNSWWKHEIFNISALLSNCTQALIRFRLADGGPVGPSANAGWFLDNVRVNCSFSEMTPPLISWVTSFPSMVFQSSAIPVKAVITDGSGIDSAMVVYSVNGGMPDTLGMSYTSADTLAATFPLFNSGDEICFSIYATDASPAHNSAVSPGSSCIDFQVYTALTPPFYDDFETAEYWIPNWTGGTSWEKGKPNYGQTNTTHYGNQAWDVNLNSGYGSNADCKLYSPVFDFSGVQNATISFWVNYHTESNYDGVNVEYSTNGTSWQILGTINDPNGVNWYNSQFPQQPQKPAWTGTSNGWKKVKYKLTGPGFVSSFLRFRLVFTSNYTYQLSGFSIDDFMINTEDGHEIGLESIVAPVTGCNAGINPLTILIKNSGIDTISDGISAGFQIQNGTVYNEIIPDTIPPDTYLHYTFQTPVMLMHGTGDSTFLVKVWVNLPDDPDPSDDTLASTVISKFIPPPPSVTNTNTIYGGQASLFAASSYYVRWFSVPAGGTTLGTNPTYITPYLYQTTVYYASALAPSGCFSPRVPDTVFVAGQPQTDMALTYFYKPISSPALTAQEVVKIRIRNLGSQPIPGLSVSYKLDNEPIVTESITSVINPWDTLQYTFNQTVNLENMQYYHITTWVSTPGDTVVQNDTLKRTLVHNDYVYCTSHPMASQSVNIGNFSLNNLSHGSGNPVVNNLSATGRYTDYSQSLPPIILAKGQSYPVSVSPVFFGPSTHSNCVRIFADWNHNGVFEFPAEVAFTSGPIQNGVHSGTLQVPANAVQAYTRLRVILQETTDPNIIFPCNDYTFGETEDYLAYVYSPLPVDAGVSLIDKPATVIPFGTPTPCSVRISNFGSSPIQQMTIGYTLDTLPPVVQNWTGNIPAGMQFEIPLTPFTPDSGSHSLCVYVELPGDANPSNNALCKSVLATYLTPLPYSNSFDSLAFDDFIPSGTTATQWVHGSPLSGNFPTQGPFSAPGIWATNLNMTGYTNNALAYLTTPIFDFRGAFNARVHFRYSMNTQFNADGVQFEYSDNAGTSWHPIGVVNDPLGTNWNPTSIVNQNPGWTGSEFSWKKASCLLQNLNKTSGIQFRFVFLSNASTTYQGFALDDFSLTIPCQTDIALDSILLPLPIDHPAQHEVPVQVIIRNNGADTVALINISYQFNSGTPVTEIISIPQGLKPEESITYTFNTNTLIPAGPFSVFVRLTLPNDCSVLNDTLSVKGEGIPVFLPSYFSAFDSAGAAGWKTSDPYWESGSPSSVIIDSAYSAPFCWKTNLNGFYPATSELHYLYTPFFVSSQYLDSLVFMHRYHFADGDFGRVEYLSAFGWQNLGYPGTPLAVNWYNTGSGFSLTSPSNTWIRSAINLKPYHDFADPARFRFVFYGLQTNGMFDGWAIDDVTLTAEIAVLDAGVSGIQQPFWVCQAGDSLHVQVMLKNFGLDTLTEIPLAYRINGMLQAQEVFTGNLLTGQSETYTFAQTLHIPQANFEIQVYSELPMDQHSGNDTLTATIQVLGTGESTENTTGISIVPSPCIKICHAQFYLSRRELVNLSIVDCNGRFMLQRELMGQQGQNSVELDVSSLGPGSYFLRIMMAGKISHAKVTVIK